MKLRTTQNSIRLRLRKSELQLLKAEGLVEESVQFPNGLVFSYALIIDDTTEDIKASLIGSLMRVHLPELLAEEWITTNKVSLETTIPLAGDQTLYILVEKDFPCKDREDEDKDDTFWELVDDGEGEKC